MKYLVEHMEERWGQWCELEYRHMRSILAAEGDVNSKAKKDELWFTNVTDEQRGDFERSLWADLTPESKECKAVLEKRNLGELRNEKELVKDWSRVCLLDMEADKPLTPEDIDLFDCVVLGGILGNVHVDENADGTVKYSSDDRTAELRDPLQFVHRRHLGSLQMTTDTALLVAKMILKDQHTLSSIPWVDEPEITADMELKPNESAADNTEEAEKQDSKDDDEFGGMCECVEMTGFRYVARRGKNDAWIPTLPVGMAQYLIASNDDDLGDELFAGSYNENINATSVS